MRSARFLQPLVLVIAAQAACLLLGLWIHGRFVNASATWSADKQRREELAAIAPPLLHQLESQPVASILEETDTERRAQADARSDSSAVAAMHLPGNVALVVADPLWRLKTAFPAQSAAHWKKEAAKTISWRADGDTAGATSGPYHGTIQTPAGPRRALCYRLPEAGGYALIYRNHDDLDAAARTVTSQLPAAAVMAFFWICGLQSIVVYVAISRLQFRSARLQAQADEAQRHRTQDLVRTRDAVIFGLAKLTESRDSNTGQHLERITLYSTRLASALRRYPTFHDIVTPAFVRLIGISSALHDIGKVGLEDDILLKPGELTGSQRARMQAHALIGGECLRQIEQRLGTSNFLEMAREIALHHHERWDGSGYPAGLSGERIPLAARIVAVADTYDALSSRRTYKEPLFHERCVEYIAGQGAKHFDPRLVQAFLEIHKDFETIARQHSEEAPRPRKIEPTGEDPVAAEAEVKRAVYAIIEEIAGDSAPWQADPNLVPASH